MTRSAPALTKMTVPILIVGSRRSGTTLLPTMLSRHPDLLVHPGEPQFILDLYRRFGRCITDVPEAVAHVSNHRFRPATLEPSELLGGYHDCKQLALGEFVRRYIMLWAGAALRDKKVVLKDPYFIRHLDLVLDLFPGATLIHMIRDPRANVSSQRARWSDAGLWECITWWRDAARVGREFTGRHPGRCLEIRYEDLVETPEQTLRSVCGFLNISFTPKLLEFEFETISFVPNKEPEPVRYTRPDPARLTLWQAYLTPVEVALIERACHRDMAWYQYEAVAPPVSAVTVVARSMRERLGYQPRAWLRRQRDMLRRAIHFLRRRLYCPQR